MKKRLRIIVPLLVLVVAGIIIYDGLTGQDDSNTLHFSGNIEVTESRLSFRIPGRLIERLVEEGDKVVAGQLLARLDQGDQAIGLAEAEANLAYSQALLTELEAGSRKEEINRAKGGLLKAEQRLSELKNGSRKEEIESAKADLHSVQAAQRSAIVQLKQAKTDHNRYLSLFKEKSVSRNVLETYQTLFETAESRVQEVTAKTKAARQRLLLLEAGPRIEQIRQAEAALQQARAEFQLVKSGPRVEQINQAKAKVRLAEEQVKKARQQLSYTQLSAPMNGIVLTCSAEVGEYLNPTTPVVNLGQLNKPWVRAYINEKDLGRIHLGQPVEVSSDSYPDKSYSGRVSYISAQAEFTPKTVQTFEERVKLMFRIKVLLEDSQGELKPGMPADGLIKLSDS